MAAVDSYPIVVLAPYAGMVANILGHLASARVVKTESHMVALFAGFFIGAAAMAAVALVGVRLDIGRTSGTDTSAYLLTNVLTYLALGYGYFHFVNINLASLRIRVLREIRDAADGLAKADILSRYSSEDVITNRLNRLVRGGHLVETGGRYVLGENRAFLVLFWLFEGLKYGVLGRGNQLVGGTQEE